jgi:NAD(P)-dependent dehydrogenase (short-subunit alcohol dehydrogenase family)
MNKLTNPSAPPVAWITGSGAARVGKCIARHFADRGYRIAVHAHTSRDAALQFVDELRAQNCEAMAVFGAVDDPSFASQAVAEIREQFGRLDVLVNSAAIWSWKDLALTTSDDLRRQWEVNSLGTFLCSQAAGLQMVQQTTGGSILLIGDWAVHRPYSEFAAYFASKGNIETLTRVLAVEFANRNPAIRVNAILPGPVMLDTSIPETNAAKVHAQSLLKIPGKPEHVAEAAYFLATHEFITGVCLNVDGGRSLFSESAQDAIAHPTYRK